jgi:DNA-binding winged helix-turn-helix (wHTH) protein/tetratricopeptide (TPR) repeat protein
MLNKARRLYEFGPYRIDPDHRQLLRQNQPVLLQPKAFDILLTLVENSEKVVLKDDLMKKVWPDTFVEESNLSQHIFVLRKALGDAVEERRYIVTVPGRGYRFAETVRVVAAAQEERKKESGTTKESGTAEDKEEQIVLATRSLAKVTHEKDTRSDLRLYIATGAVVAAIIVAIGLFWRSQLKPKLTEKDTVVLADFANRTGDPVFDDTLKTALGIALAQSPFLNTLADNRVRTTLGLMARSVDAKINPDVAQEICQRTGGKAYIAGSISQLGSQYVLTLEALDCQNGDTMAREQVTAARKESVLDALGRGASKLRGELGESLTTVQKFDVALPQSTTPSLEALKAYSVGEKFLLQRDPASAPPYFQHALELDPNFAMAYAQLGITYYSLNQPGRAKECFARAFALRQHTSEREKQQIAAAYYGYGTGELIKAIQALQEEVEIYKRSGAYNGLSDLYSRLGQYEKAAEAARMLLGLDPTNNFGFVNLALDDLAMQNFSGARQVIRQAKARADDSYLLHNYLYTLSFLQADSGGMAEEQRWFAGQPVYDHYGFALAADTEAYSGHVNKARELTRLAADSAVRADNKEDAAMYRANSALQEAAFGYSMEARQAAAEALKLAAGNPGVAVQAALAFAATGEGARAVSLIQDLSKRFPLDTQLQLLGVPAIQAQLQFGRREPDLALNTLRAGLLIEFANTPFSSIKTSCLYPTYLRGEAYLAAGQGGAAAAEFQKILDHSGIVWNCWTGALAHLGVARANALQARTLQRTVADSARARALAAYKNFLTLWKDADSDIPILKQAQDEYAKMQ